MSSVKGLQRSHLMAIALAVAFLVVGGVAVRRASKLPAVASSKEKVKGHARERLHKGVGSEVRFAPAGAKAEQIDDAVGSAAEFIYWRSGLRMSDETRKTLVGAEGNVLRGKAKHITLAELTDTLTGAVVERMATLTDDEILLAADASTDGNGEIRPRADGKWGSPSKQSLIRQAKAGREWSQRGDAAPRAALRLMIEEEVNERVATLGAALPVEFGQAGERGVTPAQALLIAYSVAADDPLTDSRSDIEQMMVQKRMEARVTREQRKAQKNVSGHPYGKRGMVHPSAAHLFFKTGVDKIVNRGEGGKK